MKVELEICKCGNTNLLDGDCTLDNPNAHWVCCWPTKFCVTSGCSNPVLKLAKNSKHCSDSCRRRDQWMKEKQQQNLWTPTVEWTKMREMAWDNSKGKCCLCGLTMVRGWKQGKKIQFTIEHRIPTSRGGTDDPDNINGSHWSCNEAKRGRLESELPEGWKEEQIQIISNILFENELTIR